MKVAVLTLLRDRLDYTRHCYQTLIDNAGIDFDWYVVDQGSRDETPRWLEQQAYAAAFLLPTNIGICPALNMLLDQACDPAEYDVIVRWDNDCELLMPGTLRTACEVADERGWILAPTVLGLLSPPAQAEHAFLGEHLVAETTHLGGIFQAIPADLFSDFGFRYDESFPPYLGDEAICSWWRAQGGRCGYLVDWKVNHYERVAEQRKVLPDYQARKEQEMAAV
jgi:GT2 family glycosyltransferase